MEEEEYNDIVTYIYKILFGLAHLMDRVIYLWV
jgi:hypothetical protein